ncbi:c-type cytochrome biogenesis protein CcmI, partial [Limimaricola sp. ASW11-118]
MLFWIIAAGLSAIVLAALLAPLRRRDTTEAPAPDVAFYKGQMSEIENEHERGLLSKEETERARTEIARRLLAADRSDRTVAAGRGPTWPAAAL